MTTPRRKETRNPADVYANYTQETIDMLTRMKTAFELHGKDTIGITWADVGDANRYHDGIKEIHDMIFGEGEYEA